VVVARQVPVVQLVKQLTNDPKVENSNLAAASIGWPSNSGFVGRTILMILSWVGGLNPFTTVTV